MTNLTAAIEEWKSILGVENVLTDEIELTKLETTTFITNRSIPAVIRPKNSNEVQECVRIANKYKTPIYPISCGKNWGYGSRVPVKDRSVVMDLSRLNRIIDFDEKMAYVTVEPGVTFKQLYIYLRSQNSNLFFSVTGTTSSASLIGNVLERGIGKGPYGDRCSHVCNFEIVLPNGESIYTGFGRFPNAKTASLTRWGVGPSLDSLFTQSNFGIVTKMTIWLTPLPKYFQTFYYCIKTDSALEDLIDTLRELRLNNALKTNFVITNDYRRLSLAQQYPWNETEVVKPLSGELFQKLKKQRYMDAVWFGEGALYCLTKQQSEAERDVIEQYLEDKVDELIFFDKDKFYYALSLQKTYQWMNPRFNLAKKVSSAYDKSGFAGFPRNRGLVMAYWRKKELPPTKNPDLDRDKCGVMWISPSVPFDGRHVRTVVEIIKEMFSLYKFEPNIGLNCSTERVINVTAAIFYDREEEGEDQQANICYNETFKRLVEEGYIPYRLSIDSMNFLSSGQQNYNRLIRSLKSAIDPNNILAPGRYDCSED